MRVRFSAEAKLRLRLIHSYLSSEAPQQADAVVDRLTRRAERIGDFPQAGRVIAGFRQDALREALERPYRIVYRIDGHEVVIVTIMHYRQLLPEDLA